MFIRNDRHVTVHLVLPGTAVGTSLPDVAPGAIIEVPDVLANCSGECAQDHLHRVPDGFTEVPEPRQVAPKASKGKDEAAAPAAAE